MWKSVSVSFFVCNIQCPERALNFQKKGFMDRKQFITNSHCAFDSKLRKIFTQEIEFSKFSPYSTFKINYFTTWVTLPLTCNCCVYVYVCMSLLLIFAIEQMRAEWMKNVFIKSQPGEGIWYLFILYTTLHTYAEQNNKRAFEKKKM